MNGKWLYIAYACAWLATGAAVIVGIIITNNPSCLWALLIPTFISISHGGKGQS